MRKRIHRVANFLAFNLLFFAIYLNFIYKDPSVPTVTDKNQEDAAAFSETLTAEKSLEKKGTPAIRVNEAVAAKKIN
ncbi:MAG: hypothetical protein E6Q24_08920 [Chitinophagaceae bacterium]|nr:MAG: hypothetical protein E6Q24_08920 [Chitinophagaceae bacterium]